MMIRAHHLESSRSLPVLSVLVLTLAACSSASTDDGGQGDIEAPDSDDDIESVTNVESTDAEDDSWTTVGYVTASFVAVVSKSGDPGGGKIVLPMAMMLASGASPFATTSAL